VTRTIEQIEALLEEDLFKLRAPQYKAISTLRERLIPPGYRAHVQLLAKGGRKKRKDASADSWSPKQVKLGFLSNRRLNQRPTRNPCAKPGRRPIQCPISCALWIELS
jgi:hypothetical protein